MPEALYLSAAALLSLLGMCWLALSMDVHWAQVRQLALAESHPPRNLLKVLGYVALCLSLVVCLAGDRPSIAILVWVMLMSGAAVCVAWGLSKSPQVFRACWPF